MLPALAFAWTAIQTLMPAVPELIRLFGGSGPMPERNAKAVETIGSMISSIGGGAGVDQSTAKLLADPAALAQFRIQLQDQWNMLWGMVKEAEAMAIDRVDRLWPSGCLAAPTRA